MHMKGEGTVHKAPAEKICLFGSQQPTYYGQAGPREAAAPRAYGVSTD